MRIITSLCILFELSVFCTQVYAEGMLDFQPYVGVGTQYDDNVFRFSSRQRAKELGFNKLSDTLKRVNAGVNANLTLSRQLISFSARIEDNQYNRFDFLDNLSKDGRLAWEWKLGDRLSGELSSRHAQSIVGFTENKTTLRNLRTIGQQRALVNLDINSSWIIYGSLEDVQVENDERAFFNIDRKDDTKEIGVRFSTPASTQLGLSYRHTVSDFPKRDGFAEFFFGNESTQNTLSLFGTWLPTPKTRLNAILSRIDLDRESEGGRDFSGFSQRWVLDHTLTGKTILNITAYEEVSPIDDVLSTFVRFKGLSTNLTWTATAKTSIVGSVGIEDRDFLGGGVLPFSGVDDRSDLIKNANLSLIYNPKEQFQIRLEYARETRDSNLEIQSYEFNNFNLSGRYQF